MEVNVRVALDAGAPVVVKTASGPGIARLRRERERLEQAEHPGVVALAGPAAPPGTGGAAAAGEYELRTWYAGEPVSRWTGALADVAGVGAAVASTLADLHEIGMVHGRLDATHVLLGADGRPRLCGFAEPGENRAADDVAALGRLVHELLARAPDDRRGLLRGRRASAAARRALADVAGLAIDPVPARRPSARRLAEAILAAVAGARLPEGSGSPTGDAGPPGGAETASGSGGESASPWPQRRGRRLPRASSVDAGPEPPSTAGTTESNRLVGHGVAPTVPSPSAAGPSRQPDTLDRIWSYAGQQSDDERWALALGDGPPDIPPRPGATTLPMAVVDTPDWSVTSKGPDDAVPPDARSRASAATDDRFPAGPNPATAPSPAAGPNPDGTHSPAAGPDRNDAGVEPPARSPAPPLTAPVIDDTGPAGERADDRTRDHLVAGGRVGVTRRPATADAVLPTAAPPRRRAAQIATASLAVVLAIGAVLALGSGGGADSSRPDLPAEAAAPSCTLVAAPKADVDGDGCPEPLVVEGGTVDAGVAQWALGEPGDLITLGDWDCDGEASAALLRPASGDIFVFSGWAEAGSPVTVDAIHRAEGAVGLRPEADGRGCDHLVADLAGGGSTPVEVPR